MNLYSIRQLKAMIAMNIIRHCAAKDGFLSDNEINNIISKVRKDSHTNSAPNPEENLLKTRCIKK